MAPKRRRNKISKKKLFNALSNKSCAFRFSMSRNCMLKTGGGDTFCLSLPNWPLQKFNFLFFRVFVRRKQNFDKKALMHYVWGFSGAWHKKIIKTDENWRSRYELRVFSEAYQKRRCGRMWDRKELFFKIEMFLGYQLCKFIQKYLLNS
jgi:hypothetical protein